MLLGLGEHWNRDALHSMIEEQALAREWQEALTFAD